MRSWNLQPGASISGWGQFSNAWDLGQAGGKSDADESRGI